MVMKRRDFVKSGAGAAVGAAVGVTAFPNVVLGHGRGETVRIGVIGTGLRGRSLLGLLLRRDDTRVSAICDIDPEAAGLAAEMITGAGQKSPKQFTAGDHDYLNLLRRDDVDAVLIATPWTWHAPMAIAAMNEGKTVGVEVPAALTVEEAWELVRMSERTGVSCMMLENVCYRRDVMAVLNMARQGLFGELVHCRCGYQHDLRAVKLQPGVQFGAEGRSESMWRTQHSIKRDGDLYPTHGIGPVGNWLDINRGNRFVSLTSTSSKARGLHDYIVARAGAEHPNASIRFALGDVVTTVVRTAMEESVVITHDTNLPRPYSLGFRVQGTRGLWMMDGRQIYIEGVSPEPHRWEAAGPYMEQYDHPLWRRYESDAVGAGHGGMDFFVVHGFVEAIKRGEALPLDVYDAAAWSVISPLSERSIAEGGEPQQFPDFTGGRWVKRAPTFAMGEQY
jgi:predicted dehydrogenase